MPTLRTSICIGLLGTASPWAGNLDPWVDSNFQLFWPSPVRAHPGVPLDFQFSVYESENQSLRWELENSPPGMTISSQGEVDWTPTPADSGTRGLSVRVTRGSGQTIVRSFAITVGSRDFLFVSPTGSDSADGSIAHPLRTLDKAMRSVKISDGKTIYARGGVYREHYAWETGGVHAPFGGIRFSPDDPMVVRGFPGETAILDCEGQGQGLWSFGGSHVVYSHLTVRNASRAELGGVILGGDSGVAQQVEVHDSHWSASDNVTGFQVHGGTGNLIDRCIAHDNRDTLRDHWNSTNYLVYCDGDTGVVHLLNSVSWGTNTGFKIKHAGPKRLILHNDKSFGDAIGFGVGSRHSSVRYSVADGNKVGIQCGIADPNAFTTDSVLVQHNTIVDPAEWGIYIQDSYFYAGAFVRRNLIIGRHHPAGTAEADHRLLGSWLNDGQASTHTLSIDSNLYHAPSPENIVRQGNGIANYSFASWRATGHDTHSLFADPLFADTLEGHYALEANSPAFFGDGTFAGAFGTSSSSGTHPPERLPKASGLQRLSAHTPIELLDPRGRPVWRGAFSDLPRSGLPRGIQCYRILGSDPRALGSLANIR